MSGARRTVVVSDEDDGARADAVVARALGVGVRQARALFDDGGVTRGGRAIAKGDRVARGDALDVRSLSSWLSPAEHAWLAVVYQDAGVVVVDKPAGVPSHPLARGEGGTVADALAFAFPECAAASDDEREGGLVHRLDTFTSGLLAAARSREEWRAIRRAFGDGDVARAYLALVEGTLEEPLVVDAPIAHDPSDRRRMVVVTDDERDRARGAPKPACTEATPVAVTRDASLVVVRARGGRRHQVRVHLASAGFPLVGDALYGARTASRRAGHLLHAAMLGLPGRRRLVCAPPDDFTAAARERGLAADDVERALSGLRAP